MDHSGDHSHRSTTVTNIATCIFSTPQSAHRVRCKQAGRLFRELSHVYSPFIWAKLTMETYATSAKSAGKSLGTSLHQSPIGQIAEIVDRRMMFPCIRSARLNEYTL